MSQFGSMILPIQKLAITFGIQERKKGSLLERDLETECCSGDVRDLKRDLQRQNFPGCSDYPDIPLSSESLTGFC